MRAREDLSRRGIGYENHLVDEAPVNRQATLAVARGAQRMLVKTGDTVTRLDAPFTDADVTRHLVHEDGFLRVPVLLIGDLLVRGYTEELYRAALDRSPA